MLHNSCMVSKSNRLKWIISGVIIGGLFGLWVVLTTDAHNFNFLLPLVMGAYLGNSLCEKSPRERLNFVGLFFTIVVLHEIWVKVLDPISLPTANCCGTGPSDKFETSMLAWGLCLASLACGAAIWQRVTKRIASRKSSSDTTAQRLALLKAPRN